MLGVLRKLSLGRSGAARFLRWRGDWELQKMGDRLAQGQEQLRVGEEAHSCSPGSLPRAQGSECQGKQAPFPSPTTAAAPRTLNCLGKALPTGRALRGPRTHTVTTCGPEQVPSPCCRGMREKLQTCLTLAV